MTGGVLISRQADPGTVDADNPWPGLASFREADRELFYGREAETQEVLRLALRERLTVLFGLSGLGKTSLLRAGLFPLLRQENVLPVYVRLDFSGTGPGLMDQVRQAILREAEDAGVEAPAFPASETLWENLHRQGAELWSPRNRIITPLLVFDQFEEVFTLGRVSPARAQETEAFLTELADLCEGSVPASVRERLEADPAAARELSFARHPYKILLSLREDFLPELEGLRGRIRSIVHNRLRLRRMNGDNALRVITQPGGHLVEPDVPERIVRFVAGRESDEIPRTELEIEPALLSVVCRELNNKRRAQDLPRITADLVRGNRDEILSDLYERSVGDLGPDVRSFIEERLLTRSGFRDSVALENAVESPGVTREALDKLTDRRLLRIEDRAGMQRLELTHDVLTGVIRKSRDSRREREARAQQEVGRREAERKLRRSRLALALLGLVLLGVATFAAWGFNAQRVARKALAGSDVGRASYLQESNPKHALAYLARAIRLAPESVPAQSLLTDLLLYKSWSRPVNELRINDTASVDLSDDGRFFAAVGDDGTVRLWDTRTLQRVGKDVKQSQAVDSLDISRDGRRVLILSPGTAQLWDIQTGKPVLKPLELDEQTYALLSPDGQLRTTDLKGYTEEKRAPLQGARSMEKVPARKLSRAEISRDGKLLLTTSEAGVELWNADTGRPLSQAFCDCSQARFLAGTRQVVTGDDSDDGVLRVWGTEPSRTATKLLPDPAFAIFSRDGSRLAVRTADGTIQLWDTEAVRPVGTPIRDFSSRPFALSADGRFLLERNSKVIQLREAQTGRPLWTLPFPTGSRFGSSVGMGGLPHFNPEKKLFAFQSERSTVKILSLVTGQALGTARHDPEIVAFAFSPGGEWLVTVSSRGGVRRWDSQGHLLGDEIPHESRVYSLDFSPDGGRFATGTRKGLVRIWDLRSGAPLLGPLRHRYGLNIVLFQNENRLLVGAHTVLKLWNLETGRTTGAMLDQKDFVHFAQLSPDGDRLLIQSSDEPVRLLDARTGYPLLRTAFTNARPQLSPSGQLLWILGEGVHVYAIPRFPKKDRDLLARWAEAVGGWTLDEEGRLVELSDQLFRLEALRRETADAPPGQLRAASLIRWFLSDPKTRPVSPVFERTIDRSGD
jgi:WD40 repeat protein